MGAAAAQSFILAGLERLPYRAEDQSVSLLSPCWIGGREVRCELFHVGDHGTERVPVEGIAVQRLGMEHELSALRGRHGGGDTDLAAELVRRAGFPLADALDLRRM